MTPFFTGDGDDGTTGLLGEGRIPKHHSRAEAIGALDEAVAALGLARALGQEVELRTTLETVQRHLYQVMAEVAAPGDNAARFRTIGRDQVAWLEKEIENREKAVESPGEFLLGGDSAPGASLDLARTAVRRAERRLSRLVEQGELDNPWLLAYLNRASSLVFVMILESYARQLIDPTRARSPGASRGTGEKGSKGSS